MWPSNNIAVRECQIDAARSEPPPDSCLPHSLESNASDTRIANRVFGVAMPKIVLDQPSGHSLDWPGKNPHVCRSIWG